MNTFETLLEIKTAKKDLSLKAIYIKNPFKRGKGTFYIYYYDKTNHSFYINGLNKNTTSRTTFEEIINRAFKKESNQNKKPKVFYFTKSDDFVYIDKIELKSIRNSNLEIKELKVGDIKSYS